MLCWLFAATGWLGNFHSQMIAFPSVVIWNSFAESILGNWELRRLEKLLWRSWWLTKHILDEDERGSLAWRQGENPGSRRGGLDNLAMSHWNVFCPPDLFILWSDLVHSKVVLAHVYLISRTALAATGEFPWFAPAMSIPELLIKWTCYKGPSSFQNCILFSTIYDPQKGQSYLENLPIPGKSWDDRMYP